MGSRIAASQRKLLITWLEMIAFNHPDFGSQMRAFKVLREVFGVVYAS